MRMKILTGLVVSALLHPTPSLSQIYCVPGTSEPICNSFEFGATVNGATSTLWVNVLAYPGITMTSFSVQDGTGRVPFNGSGTHLFQVALAGSFTVQAEFDYQTGEILEEIAAINAGVSLLQDMIAGLEQDIAQAEAGIPDPSLCLGLSDAELEACLESYEDAHNLATTHIAELREAIREREEQIESLLLQRMTLEGQYDSLIALGDPFVLDAGNLGLLSWSGSLGGVSYECRVGEPGCELANTSVVPEPGTVLLLGTGLFGLGIALLRRKGAED